MVHLDLQSAIRTGKLDWPFKFALPVLLHAKAILQAGYNHRTHRHIL